MGIIATYNKLYAGFGIFFIFAIIIIPLIVIMGFLSLFTPYGWITLWILDNWIWIVIGIILSVAFILTPQKRRYYPKRKYYRRRHRRRRYR